MPDKNLSITQTPKKENHQNITFTERSSIDWPYDENDDKNDDIYNDDDVDDYCDD